MLLDKPTNISLSNRPFNEKLEVYKERPLHQQKEIEERFVADTEHPVWDKAAIERRCKTIVEAAEEIWDLDRI